jgi:hypothetical protein
MTNLLKVNKGMVDDKTRDEILKRIAIRHQEEPETINEAQQSDDDGINGKGSDEQLSDLSTALSEVLENKDRDSKVSAEASSSYRKQIFEKSNKSMMNDMFNSLIR